MSDIKIQPSATGSGTVTITAPTTNTARVITLPDSAGTLLDENSSVPSANLTGTVVDARISALTASKLTGDLPAISGVNVTNVHAVNSGRKNLIINGGFDVAQRATSATGLGSASGYFTLDRWNVTTSTTGRFTMSQSTDAPIGFSKSMKLDCTTADTSIAANEYSVLGQVIEAQNIQGMARGTSGAKEVTVSFYVKGNASTTYVCELQGEGRDLSKTFNVTTAWEKVELTFPADTNAAAAPTYDNTAGIYLYIWVQAGSTYSGGSAIPTAWADQPNANRCVGIGNFFSSTSNELYMTGVQIEVGSVATDFEHRSYGEELALCQRYFSRQTNLWSDTGGTSGHRFAPRIFYPVTMRSVATVTLSSVTTSNMTAPTPNAMSKDGTVLYANLTTTTVDGSFTVGVLTADAEL